MKTLRPVISVCEIPPNRASSRLKLPSIRSLVSDRPCKDEQKILRYLQQGVFGCFYPDSGLGHDFLEPGKKADGQLADEALGSASPTDSPTVSTSIMPGGVLTDGEWLWPSVLPYYVAKYHVQVDPEFVDYARSKNWTIREAEIQLDDLVFDAFWEKANNS